MRARQLRCPVCVFSHKVLTQKTHPARFTHKDGSDCILTQVGLLQQECGKAAYFIASSIATATATVAPTIGLLPNVGSTFFTFSPIAWNILLLLKFQRLSQWLIAFYFFFFLKITHDFSFFAHKLHTTFPYISNSG